MFSKEEGSNLKRKFWTSYGQYMKPILSSEGERVNWVNYKTGVKNIFFKLDAEQKYATVTILINHSDIGIRTLFYEQFLEFKSLLENYLGEKWECINITDGLSIQCTLDKVSIYDEQQWPEIISFFKQRMIALDEFWNDVKSVFLDLQH